MRRGITLTEVVVGLALLGSLLTMMLIAAGRLERQRRTAETRLEAVAVLDRLVSGFFSNGFPALPSSGPIIEHDGMAWQMSKVAIATPEECSVARVSVVQWKGSESTTVASVDVLVADTAFGQNQVVRLQP